MKKYIYFCNTQKDLNPRNRKKTTELYYKMFTGIWDYIFNDYTKKDLLVKVVYKVTATHTLAQEITLAEFLMHLIFWRCHISFGEPIVEEDFHEINPLTGDRMRDIMESIAKKFVLLGHDTDQIAYQLSIMIDQFSYLAEGYSPIAANTFSLWDIGQLEKRSPAFKALLSTQLDDTLPVKELEKYLGAAKNKLFTAIREDGKSALYPYIQSGRLDKTQMVQMFVAVGPRPDIDKSILPRPIHGSYLKGLQDIGEYYVEAVSARVALLTKHTNVRLSGYLSRKINVLCLSTDIDWTVEDCHTPNFVSFFVESEERLRMIVGKYMITDKGTLVEITKNDIHLIGQVIKFRSHICCTLNGTQKVCKTCYGAHHKTLKGTRIGGLPSIKFANPLSQRSMSAKHKLSTDSYEIVNPTIIKFFNEYNSALYIKPEYCKLSDAVIVLDREYIDDIIASDVDMDDETLDTTLPLDNVRLMIGEEEYPIENEGLFIALSEDIISKGAFILNEVTDTYHIPLKKIDPTAPVFTIILYSEEISRYLALILGKIESAKTKDYKSWDEIVNDVAKVVLDSGMMVSICHLETMLYSMIRDPLMITQRPDFSKPNPPHCCLNVSRAIIMKDMNTSLAFQGLKEQFKNVNSFVKTGESVFDPFFRSSPIDYGLDELNNIFAADPSMKRLLIH